MFLVKDSPSHNKSEKFKNFFRQFENLFFSYILQKEIGDSQSVLDVGCGNDSPIGHIRRSFTSTGIDIYPECIKESRKKKLHTKHVLGDVRKLKNFFKDKIFDAVISIDVIEHLTKTQSLTMISQMEHISKNKVILMTPRGYIDQGAVYGNPYQIHHSGWSTQELQNLGYRVYGLRGLKNLRNDEASIRLRPWIFWGTVSAITEVLLFCFPNLSFQLFAVKLVQPGNSKNKTHV